MRRLLSAVFLGTYSQIQPFFNLNYKVDPKIKPTSLLDELKSNEGMRCFIKKINHREQNRSMVLHKIILVHWCLIYDPSLCQAFKEIDFKNLSSDEWLNTNLLSPYNNFLQKICYSKEFYEKLRLDHILVFNLDKLFAIRRFLVNLFAVVKKIDGLELYYDHEATHNNKVILEQKHITEFVSICSYHAQQLYAVFKAILGQMLRFPDKYLSTPQKKGIIKYFLKNELDSMNEEMQALFLNKIYQPINKGYGVKLLRLEELPQNTKEYVNRVLFPQKKHVRKSSVDSFIFDKSGKINDNIIHGLKKITHTSHFSGLNKPRRKKSISLQIEVI